MLYTTQTLIQEKWSPLYLFDVVCFTLRLVRWISQCLLFPGPGHYIKETEMKVAAQSPVSQAVLSGNSTSLWGALLVLQWRPCEARWGDGPGLRGEWDAVWAEHGVPWASLPPHRVFQLQHLPRHHRQPDLLRTWCMFSCSLFLVSILEEYPVLCSRLARPHGKPAAWLCKS